jgi:hypothetical protein
MVSNHETSGRLVSRRALRPSGCDDLSVNGMAGMGGLAHPSIQSRLDTNRQRFLLKKVG